MALCKQSKKKNAYEDHFTRQDPARIVPQPDHTGGFPFIIPGIPGITGLFKIPSFAYPCNASLGNEKAGKESGN